MARKVPPFKALKAQYIVEGKLLGQPVYSEVLSYPAASMTLEIMAGGANDLQCYHPDTPGCEDRFQIIGGDMARIVDTHTGESVVSIRDL